MSKRIGIVLGSFHKEMIQRQLDAARAKAGELGIEIVEEVWVPGSVEKPFAVSRLLRREDIDGVVMLGVIEKGGTKHGFVMGQSLMHFAMNLSVVHDKPVCLGVLGPGIEPDQIEPRLVPYAEKAIGAVNHMLELS